MAPGNDPPILVTGAHRSGTTWTGQVLSECSGVQYIDEPFKPSHRRGVFDVDLPKWFIYLAPTDECPRLSYAVGRLLRFDYAWRAELPNIRKPRDAGRCVRDASRCARAQLLRRRPLLKDPIALFAAGWLNANFDVQPVVLLRHPCAFVSSIVRLGQRHPLLDFLSQRSLMEGPLAHLATDIERAFKASDLSLLDEGVLLWRIFYSIITRYRASNPEWIFVRHEDLARNPVCAFQSIAERLGLQWTSITDRYLRTASFSTATPVYPPGDQTRRLSAAVPDLWRKRLTASQVRHVRSLVEHECASDYGERDW
jgi:hypothetical protein